MICTGGTPVFNDKDEARGYRACNEIFRTQRLSDESFGQAVSALGEQGVVELIAIIGYYTLIGNMLNVFRSRCPRAKRRRFRNRAGAAERRVAMRLPVS